MTHTPSQAQQFVDALNKLAGFKVWSHPWRMRQDFAQLTPFEQHDALRDYTREVLSTQPTILGGSDETYAQDLKLRAEWDALKTELGGKFFRRDYNLMVFPDRSGVLNLEAANGDSNKLGARFVYRDLDWYEVEQWLAAKGHYPQRDHFYNQIPIHSDVFFLYRWETVRRLAKYVNFRDLPLGVRPYSELRQVEIHGHARGLIQCSAVVDGRTIREQEEDRAHLHAWEALSEGQRADIEAGNDRLDRRENKLWDMFPKVELSKAEYQQMVAARWWRMRSPKARLGLEQGVFLKVHFWVAWVWQNEQGRVEPSLYIVHPFMEPDNYGLDMRFAELAQQARERMSGKARWWMTDKRHWFNGRASAYDHEAGEL